jgi:hypothetical protein
MQDKSSSRYIYDLLQNAKRLILKHTLEQTLLGHHSFVSARIPVDVYHGGLIRSEALAILFFLSQVHGIEVCTVYHASPLESCSK